MGNAFNQHTHKCRDAINRVSTGGTGITCDAGITYGTVKYTDLEIGKTSLNSMINN